MKRSKYTLKLLVKIEVLYQSGFQKTFPSNDPLLLVFCFVCFFLSQSWTFCQFTREVFSLFRTNKKAMFSKNTKCFKEQKKASSWKRNISMSQKKKQKKFNSIWSNNLWQSFYRLLPGKILFFSSVTSNMESKCFRIIFWQFSFINQYFTSRHYQFKPFQVDFVTSH